jgi:hypothetical protein
VFQRKSGLIVPIPSILRRDTKLNNHAMFNITAIV